MKTLNLYTFAAILLVGLIRPAGAQTNGTSLAPGPANSAEALNPPKSTNAPGGDQELHLNFRNAPLDMVLNYLSEAAGFIIVLDTKVEGKVDVWSNRPVSKQEAVDLLNSMLKKNGYAAVRNENVLTIVKRDDAKTRDLPVKSGNNPALIPKNDEMVTQIVPVRFANAAQMTKDLQPLLPSEANMTANESGNALVITDTQAHIHRMVEIVKALDTSISSISSIRVFPLRYADAKELASAVKDLFAPPPTQQNQNGGGRAQQFFNRFGGGGPGGGGPGGAGAQSSNSGAPNGNRVVAIADERTNSLVVSAPDDMMPTIQKLVSEIDVNANDVTELRVFRLVNADPVEMVEVFSQLFPDDTKANDPNQQNQGFRFNRGGFGGFGGGRNAPASAESDRMKKKGRVTAVADQRTSSIIVSAASELMPQIAEMVAQLDSNPAKKQKVFVYNLENADVQQVQQILQDMFDRNNLSANRNGANQNSALVNRSLNAVTTGNSAASSTGFGNAGGNNGGVAR
jgi:general secretion pathway protein D